MAESIGWEIDKLRQRDTSTQPTAGSFARYSSHCYIALCAVGFDGNGFQIGDTPNRICRTFIGFDLAIDFNSIPIYASVIDFFGNGYFKLNF